MRARFSALDTRLLWYQRPSSEGKPLNKDVDNVNSTQITRDHPASEKESLAIPDFLLMPLVEAAFTVVKKNEESDIPTALKRISHFDAKALNNSTARTQIIQSIQNNPGFADMVSEEFFSRVEVGVAFSQWNANRTQVLVQEAASRNDLPLLASILWIKKPEKYSFALGMIVALSSVSMMENEQRETQRAEQTKVTHLQNSFEREKGRADLLKSDVDRLEAELRDERRTRRVREQRLEAQAASLQKQVDSNDEVTLRLKEAKERTNSRLEQEASRAQELEKRLKMAQNEASVKSEKISQLQEQLASALSSEMELTYEDLQKLILAQKNAEEISSTIMAIMNKTRSILSNKVTDSSNQLTAPQNTQGPSQVEQVTLNSQTPTRLPERKAAIEGTKRTPVVVPPGMPLESDASLRTVFTQQDLVILIDGYNVSLNSFGNLSLELQRDRIVACATSVEARFHPSCLVVFDGQSSGTRGRIQSKVHVVFSPSGVTADDVIVERIRVTPRDKPVLVVTSDRNLAARAKGLGCEVISSASFVSVSK